MTRSQTIASTIVGVIFAIITLLQSFGVQIPVIDENALTTAITGIITICIWAFQLWKNHNFTDAALQGQEVVNAIKADKQVEIEIAS